MKPTSKRFASPPSMKCELCGYYTENPIEDYGGKSRMRGRFCNEHRELIRRIDDASCVLQVIDAELSARIEFSRAERCLEHRAAEKLNRYAVM